MFLLCVDNQLYSIVLQSSLVTEQVNFLDFDFTVKIFRPKTYAHTKKNSKLNFEKSNSWFLVCPGNKLEGNESASPTQSMTMNTPPLVESQRSNEVLTQPELKTSSLALAPNSQGQLNLREEQLPATFNKSSPFKVDVYVTVVPKPKTKKSRTQRDE